MTSRRFPAPRRVEQTPGGFKVLDANGQALAYVYARETKAEADIAKLLTFDEARRIAVNVDRLPGLLGARNEQARNFNKCEKTKSQSRIGTVARSLNSWPPFGSS